MSVSTIRPRVAELTFQVFGRALHPELFQVYKTHQVARGNFTVQVDITNDGHRVTWSSGTVTITEVAASALQPLPQRRRLAAHSLQGSGSERIAYHLGVDYRYEYALERVPAEMFWMIQQQLGNEARNHELIQIFENSGRMAIGGLSFIHLETRLNSVKVQAIHTFPDDLALVKTESSFSLGS
jgi:hypothetical protein